MDFIERNKAMILEYYRTISGAIKTPELLKRFIDDPQLIRHIQAVDQILPEFEERIDEMTGEGNRVIVRSTCKGRFLENELEGTATFRSVEFPVAVGYYLKNGKIVDHWMISDHMALLEQLGWLENGVKSPR
jgi:hypothetical protein